MAVHRRKCTVSLVDALSSEVVRKLRLACEAETKEDRDIVLEEVFCDVTSNLDETAQAQLGARGPQHFYAILARHYASPRGTDSAVAVLHLLQGLYGQGYAAPLLALLLHRWLLLRRVPGRGLPEEQRLRLANVLALGSAQLFLGDVHGGAKAFLPLWECLCYEVVLGQADPQAEASLTLGTVTGAGNAVPAPAKGKHSVTHSKAGGPAVVHPLDAQHNLDMGLKHPGASDQEALNGPLTALPAPGPDPGRPTSTLAVSPPPTASGLAALPSTARTGLLAAVAAPLVCYADPKRLEELLQLFPPPTAMPATQSPFAPRNLPPPIPEDASGGKPSQAARNMGVEPFSRPPLVSSPGEGVDFIMAEVVDMLSRIRSELGLIHYLNAMLALRAQPALSQPPGMRPVTRLRLQSQLYALTWSGGPHYAPKAVRTAALRVLDALYPSGRTTRGIVRALFRLLHPSDLFNDLALVTSWWMRDVVGKLLLGFFWLIYSLVVWGPTSKGRMEGSEMGEQPGRSSVWAGRDRSSGLGTPQAVQMQELVRNSPRGSSTAPSQAAEGGAQAQDGGGASGTPLELR